ncbi:putative P-loop ATPase fused to an acetyltransferase [Thioalkalivibrio nitratireducens DSM 14787]|uniref:P-loop ATPase fused to an acetyltransferase n=1 Tax=Thioalkalivibrio nitratireducens (strain DSM 14787 / UNIQEM 213 / ALEN2) TaxID=1255043 RepID=L0E3M3_THIND|nr:GNAT family N-acetyltransferase [Thioalkalivibrio nitratireducens]AGA35266.1 putative P-loop ATPase fused to an acetyltransferase [Thioalkalivibrio nitratireducens DSM 14787]
MGWFGASVPDGLPGTRPAQAGHWLGRELDALVFEGGAIPPVDALAIAAGLLRGGGVFLLLAGEPAPTPFGRRLRRFLAEDIVERVAEDGTWPVPVIPSRAEERRLNAGQRRVFRALACAPSWPPRTCAILTAPRGRGKSTLLGALVVHWLLRTPLDVRVTAPNPDAIRPLLGEVERGGGTPCRGGTRAAALYIAPDALLERGLAPDLVVVDEAAALPVHLLRRLARLAPRVAFATTTAGFEGSGQGFRHRFLKTLRDDGHRLHEFRLDWPVRWPPGDPLEDWVDRLFLLDAEAKAPATAPGRPPLRMRWVSGAGLAANESRLRAVVGLLSDAHYRTRPSDLRRWLDSPELQVGVLAETRGVGIVGVVLAQIEPGLEPGLADAVWSGLRRPPGRFLPCVLAEHGALAAARRPALRVLRIAVDPHWQRRRLGRRMLRATLGWARRRDVPVVGASFGAEPGLIEFWTGAGFRCLRIGFRRETTSGLHAAVVFRGTSSEAAADLAWLRARAARDWPVWWPARCGAWKPGSPRRSQPICHRPGLPARRSIGARFVPLPVFPDRSNSRFRRCDDGCMQTRSGLPLCPPRSGHCSTPRCWNWPAGRSFVRSRVLRGAGT